MERGFLSQKGSRVGRGVKEKDLNKNKKNTSSGIGVSRMVLQLGVTSSIVDMTVEMEKQYSLEDTTILESFLPLSMSVTATASNAPSKSLYANVTGKPSGKKLNFCTLFTLWLHEWTRCYDLEWSMVYSRNNLLILKKWHPDVNLLKEDVYYSVWVKLHGVPVMTVSEDGLSAIATKLADKPNDNTLMGSVPGQDVASRSGIDHYAYSCDELALIHRIFFAVYGV
nr:hypothetical protein [Tanacetum cinerariifolium]